jgi:tetratricopeptide (TPR) repeat protein
LLRLRMEEKNYQESLKLCINLRQNLLRVYEPKIYFQFTLYLTEVYSQLGKWQLAISLIRRESNNLYVQHRPNLLVQMLIQLGMLYKEQARYGEAKSVLEKGLELSIQYHYQVQQYEIKLHLGHVYLLSHAMLRAYEYLQQAYLWASKEKAQGVLLLANLYLSYYELQNKRIERSRKYLREAKQIVNVSQNMIDNLNYLFYLGAWLHAAQRANHLRSVINLMKRKSKNLPRYLAAADYLFTRLSIYEHKYREAEKSFRSGLKIAQQWNLPQIQYLLNCEVVRLYQLSGDETKFLNSLKKTLGFLKKMQKYIQDKILGTQFMEARFHQDVIQWGEEYHIN